MLKKTDEKKTEFISVRVSKTVKTRLEKIAEEHDRPLSWVVSRILEKHVNNKQAPKL